MVHHKSSRKKLIKKMKGRLTGLFMIQNLYICRKKYKELKSQGIKMFRELEVHKYKCDDVEYSDSEFLLQDPDGYLLRFNN